MVHKVTINQIDHIDWAKRLVIHYYLSQDVSLPTVGNWAYKPESCGYRNVCDDNWVIITPNTQHPLHSKNIKTKGSYIYVWDYGGVYGLNPADFDSSHSYIIQLALVDTTCGYVDPCANSTNVTPSTSPTPGVAPMGTAGTDGDINNTFNNCGPGYTLTSDALGCLICEFIPIITGPTEPTIILPGWTQPDPPFGEASGPVYNSSTFVQIGPWAFTYSPKPSEVAGIGPIGTPLGPASIQNSKSTLPKSPFHMSSTVSFIGGQPLNPLLAYNYAYLSSPKVPDTISLRSGRPLYGTVYGGKPPQFTFTPSRINALVHTEIREIVRDRTDDREIAARNDQLNLKAYDIRHNNIDNTLNDTLIGERPNAPTKATNAIVTSTAGESFVKFNTNNKSRIEILKSRPGSHQESEEVKFLQAEISDPLLTVGVASKKVTHNKAQLNIVDEPTVPEGVTPGSRKFSSALDLILDKQTLFKDTPDFAANYILSLVTLQSVRSGDKLFIESVLKPTVQTLYKLKMSMIIVDDNGNRHLVKKADLINRVNPLIITQNVTVNVAPGKLIILIVIEDGTKVVGYKSATVQVSDPGTVEGGALPNLSSKMFKSAIDRTVNFSEVLTVPIGVPIDAVGIIASISNSPSNDNITCAVLIKGQPNVEHAIAVYDAGNLSGVGKANKGPLTVNTGKLDLVGLSPTGEYSAALFAQYKKVTLSSGGSTNLFIVISNTNSAPSNIMDVMVSSGLTITKPYVTAQSYTNGMLTMTIQTPYPALGGLTPRFQAYESGGNNVVPLNPSIAEFATDVDGVGTFSLPCDKESYIGVAFLYPGNLSLNKRTIDWFRVNA